jgi:crotonobetainyl-CoA:carnitine CoA-transferase CaiB-like acyl-CoA transferase
MRHEPQAGEDRTPELPMNDLPTGTGASFELLAGIRVLELSTSIAGPYASLLLGDLGADVVKVERLDGGDDSRGWGPPFLDGESLWFLSVNRNKRSVAIDYSGYRGREILRRLTAKADVLISNLRLSSLIRLGLDFDSARQVRPDIIHCSITGFGHSGPRSELPCYDLVAEGLSGIMDLTGEPDDLPQKVGTPAADLLAGMDAAYGIVAALFDRQRTGRGHRLDVSLLESMTRFVTPRIMSYLGSGEIPRRTGARDSVIAIYQVFATNDDPITVAIGSDAIYQRFCQAIRRPDLGANPDYTTNSDRRERRSTLVQEIQGVLSGRSSSEWLDVFAAADVPAGPIQRIDEVVSDPQLRSRHLFYRTNGPRAMPQVNTSWQLDGAPNRYRSAPPVMGADTDDILMTWAGLSSDELATARIEGVL